MRSIQHTNWAGLWQLGVARDGQHCGPFYHPQHQTFKGWELDGNYLNNLLQRRLQRVLLLADRDEQRDCLPIFVQWPLDGRQFLMDEQRSVAADRAVQSSYFRRYQRYANRDRQRADFADTI